MSARSLRPCLVTGASRGIGLELVRQLLGTADEGLVIAACRRPSEAGELQELAESHPSELRVVQLDVDDDASVERLCGEVEGLVGDAGLRLLLNNAGVHLGGPDSAFPNVSRANLQATLETNTVSPLILTQKLVGQLERGSGLVVNVSSELGSIGRFMADVAAHRGISYPVSKAGLNMVSRFLASSMSSRGVVVVSLCPGWVATAMGGPGGVPVHHSVRDILPTLRSLTQHHTGSFIDRNGNLIPF